ncbi:MAG: DUF1049 domain-containing protein [Cyanobacteria bacterium J06627_28]
MAKFSVVIISAVLGIAIAIFSVQNATPVSITFLNAKTVALPVGIWVALGIAIGMIGTPILLSLISKKKSKLL